MLMSVRHPFAPIYDKNSKILILGSFPSVKSREQNFFYGHPQNRFWKVMAHVYADNGGGAVEVSVPQSMEEKKVFLLENGIALWDVIAECDIEGSADSTIKNAKANNISEILNNADIQKIFVNGKTAEKYYNKYVKNEIGREAVCLPSTSPANAVWTLEKLIEAWREAILYMR